MGNGEWGFWWAMGRVLAADVEADVADGLLVGDGGWSS